jgi:hypothetical protein
LRDRFCFSSRAVSVPWQVGIERQPAAGCGLSNDASAQWAAADGSDSYLWGFR